MKTFTGVLLATSLLGTSVVSAEHLSFDDIYPILEENCLSCHHNPGAPRGLSMETYSGLLKGSENGPVVIPGDAKNSELLKRLKGESYPRMPMNGPPYLNESETRLISNWIDAGLKQYH